MQSVLITGTSTGIGQATAVVLASRGWVVCDDANSKRRACSSRRSRRRVCGMASSSSSSMSRVRLHPNSG